MTPEQEDAYLVDPDSWEDTPVAEDRGTPVAGSRGLARARSSFQSKTVKPKPNEPPAARARTERDDIWDALCQACNIDPATLTPGEKSRVGRSVNDLISVGAKPLDIAARAVRYRQKYEGAALTDRALVNHWSEFSGRRMSAGGTQEQGCPECGLSLSPAKMVEHRYHIHNVGRACPECGDVFEGEHKCRLGG